MVQSLVSLESGHDSLDHFKFPSVEVSRIHIVMATSLEPATVASVPGNPLLQRLGGCGDVNVSDLGLPSAVVADCIGHLDDNHEYCQTGGVITATLAGLPVVRKSLSEVDGFADSRFDGCMDAVVGLVKNTSVKSPSLHGRLEVVCHDHLDA